MAGVDWFNEVMATSPVPMQESPEGGQPEASPGADPGAAALPQSVDATNDRPGSLEGVARAAQAANEIAAARAQANGLAAGAPASAASAASPEAAPQSAMPTIDLLPVEFLVRTRVGVDQGFDDGVKRMEIPAATALSDVDKEIGAYERVARKLGERPLREILEDPAMQDFDHETVHAAAVQYRRRGLSQNEASAKAVEGHLRYLRDEKKRIGSEVIEKYREAEPDQYAELARAAHETATSVTAASPQADPPATTAEHGADWWSEVNAQPEDAEPETSPEPAGLWDAFRTGMVEDPSARHAIYAAQRFPDMPEQDRNSLYGVVGDRDVYRDPEDGKLYYELGTKERVAQWFGENALPIAGGMIGAASVPTGGAAAVVGAPAMAALGAAGGMGYRKVAGEMQGDNQDALGNLGDMATEAAWNAAGTAAGQAIGRHIVGRRAARDLARFNADDAARLAQAAEAHGIRLTPAELTNLGSLIQQQSALGQGMDEATDTLRQFYGNRTEAVLAAVDDFIGASPGPAETGRMAVRASDGIIDDAVRSRRDAARPLYESVVRPDNVVPAQGAIGEVLKDPFLAKQVKAVKSDPLYRMGDMDDTALPVLDQVKKNLDDMIEVASRAGEKNRVRLLEQRRTALLKAADDAFPDYPAARAAFAGKSPEVDALKESAIGIVSKYKGTQLEKAAGTLVNLKTDPKRVAWARRQFEKAGKVDEWDTIASQALRDIFENARGTAAAGDSAVAQKFRTAVFGSERARQVVRSALGQERYVDLNDLMKVIEAVGRVPRQQSITHFAGEAAKREARQASPVTTFLRNLKISDPGGEILDAMTDRSVERWRARMAQIITSPEAMEELKRMRVLRGLSPKSERRLRVAGAVIGKALGLSVDSALEINETRPPQAAENRGAP